MNGVIYQLSGKPAAELLAISIWTLRKHYRGPITIFVTDDCREIADRIAGDPRCDCELQATSLMRTEQLQHRRIHTLTKAINYVRTPYDQTLSLDADTIINHPVDAFFRRGYNVCQFGSGRLMDSNRVAKSLYHEMRVFGRYSPVLRDMVAQAENANFPWINTGAWGFPKNDPGIMEIHCLCVILRNTLRTSDESALNLIAWRLPRLNWLADNYHRCAMFVPCREWREPVVLHNHSQNWVCKPSGRNAFKFYLGEVMKHNVGHITEWIGIGHPYVIKFWNDLLAERS